MVMMSLGDDDDDDSSSLPETMMTDSCYYSILMEEEEQAITDDDDDDDIDKEGKNQHHHHQQPKYTSCSDMDQQEQQQQEEETAVIRVTAETSKEGAATAQHPLCAGISFLLSRRTSLLESVNDNNDDNDDNDENEQHGGEDTNSCTALGSTTTDHDDDDTTLSCTSAWSREYRKRRQQQQRGEEEEEEESITCSPYSNNYAAATTTRAPMRRINSWLSFPSPTATLQLNADTTTSFYSPDELELSETTLAAQSYYLKDMTRPIWIVTTASLPWMTGTAVNPLLRAAYLIRYRREQEQMEWKNEDETSVNDSHNDVNTTTAAATTTAVAAPIHLVLPWLESADDRMTLYGAEWATKTCQDQAVYVRQWLAETAGMPLEAAALQLQFYPARYHANMSSIFGMGDVVAQLNTTATATDDTTAGGSSSSSSTLNDNDNSSSSKAILILEEPEHLNYYRAPSSSTTTQFAFTIGICHTNYKYYAHQHAGWMAAQTIEKVSAALVRGYCDQVLKLSGVLQEYAPHKEDIVNVHGIRQDFLQVPAVVGDKIYFIGKLLWAKGLDRLMELQQYWRDETGSYFAIDIYGSGPEQEEIQRAYLMSDDLNENTTSSTGAETPKSCADATLSDSESGDDSDSSDCSDSNNNKDKEPTTPSKNLFFWSKRASKRRHHRGRHKIIRKGPPLPVQFCGRLDHAAVGPEYKIFVNPSISEVLCTTTAEALAMGKFVILPQHPSNEFFEDFPNALFYSSPEEFVRQLQYALDEVPVPATMSTSSSSSQYHPLSWEAATERLLEATCVSEREAARRQRLGKDDAWFAQMHFEIFKGRTGDVLRKFMGAGPVSDQAQYQKEKQADQLQAA